MKKTKTKKKTKKKRKPAGHPKGVPNKITPQHQEFIAKYMKNGGNASKAAIDAGFSPNGAGWKAMSGGASWSRR